MWIKPPNDDELRFLQAELMRLGVSCEGYIEKIEKTSNGGFGLCLIGATHVLKLFRITPWQTEFAKNIETFERAVKNLTHITAAADEIARRGILVPQLVAYGTLPEKIQVAGTNYFGWYLMTRVPGVPLYTNHFPWSWYPQTPPKLLVTLGMPEIIRTAAKVQQQLLPNDKPYPPIKNTHRVKGRDQKLNRLSAEIAHDIKLTSPNNVRAHSDFHQRNLLRDVLGRINVIDWDLQRIDKAEADLGFANWLPQHIKAICHQFNATATTPVSEKATAGIGLSQALYRYQSLLKPHPTKRNWRNKERQFVQERQRVAAYARLMHKMTGKKIYLETALDFEDTQHMNKPNRPTSPRPSDAKLTR